MPSGHYIDNAGVRYSDIGKPLLDFAPLRQYYGHPNNIICQLTFTGNIPTPAVPIRYWCLFLLSVVGAPLSMQPTTEAGMWDLSLGSILEFGWFNNQQGNIHGLFASEYVNIFGNQVLSFSPFFSISFTPNTAEVPGTDIHLLTPSYTPSYPLINTGHPST